MDNIKTILIQFENELSRAEIPAFRGAVVASLEKDNVLFHNHEEESFRYSYPLIQYKCIHRKAAILCIGEGTEAIADFFTSANFHVSINRRKEELKIERIKAEKTLVRCWQEPMEYSLRHWLPFNEDNYRKYTATESLAERTLMLEHILVGNILSALKGVGVQIDEQIQCTVTQTSDSRIAKFKGLGLLCQDIMFKTNISLPNFIGLGRHTSIGFGTITRTTNN